MSVTEKKDFGYPRRTIFAPDGTNCFLSSSHKTQKINDCYIFKLKSFNMKDLHCLFFFLMETIATFSPLNS